MKKKITILAVLLMAVLTIHAQMTPPVFARTLNIAVLVYPGVGLGDLNGPIDVFTKANGITRGQYHVYTVGLSPKPVVTQGGTLRLLPDFKAEKMPAPDILVIPGGSIGLLDSMRRDTKIIDFIKLYQDKVQVLMSVCTGAYLLGQAGVFDGKKVTGHFFLSEDMQQQFPRCKLVQDVRFVDEGNLITASGVTSGIDASLYLVQRFSGDHVRKMVENAIQYKMSEKEPWPLAIGGMKFDRAKRIKMGMLAN